MQSLSPVIQCRRGKKVPKVGNSTDFGGVFSSTLTASRSFVAVIAAGEAYLAETARAKIHGRLGRMRLSRAHAKQPQKSAIQPTPRENLCNFLLVALFFPRRYCIWGGSGNIKFSCKKFDAVTITRNTVSTWEKGAASRQF